MSFYRSRLIGEYWQIKNMGIQDLKQEQDLEYLKCSHMSSPNGALRPLGVTMLLLLINIASHAVNDIV